MSGWIESFRKFLRLDDDSATRTMARYRVERELNQ